MRNVFVTGVYRSGTTLVEKLLHQHPDLMIASQPFPHLYFDVKAAFMRTLGREDRYPLGHLFLEEDYRVEDFQRFLETFEVDRALVQEAFQQVEGYTGHWTPELVDVVNDLPAGTFADVQSAMHELLARRLSRKETRVAGSKEIVCEEFGPYLLGSGVQVVLVVRDPRAVVASLISGHGERYGGEARPMLFHIRNWRKSVAFALGLQEAGVIVVRYEDVLEDPHATLAPVFSSLGLSGPDAALDPGVIIDQRGEQWRGNSSFSAAPEGRVIQEERYLDALDTRTLEFIESCAFPEMVALGYPISTDSAVDMVGFEGFTEPVPVTRAEFPSDYSTNAAAREQEHKRARLLQGGGLAPDEARRWFVFEETAQALSAAVRSSEKQLEAPGTREG